MAEILGIILPYVPANAVALVAVVIVYLIIQSKRKNTKDERDKDSQLLHDKVEKTIWEIGTIKNEQVLHRQLLDDFRSQLSTLTTEVAKLGVCIDNLTKILEKK